MQLVSIEAKGIEEEIKQVDLFPSFNLVNLVEFYLKCSTFKLRAKDGTNKKSKGCSGVDQKVM